MTSESTPLIPPSDASDDKPTVYFLEKRISDAAAAHHPHAAHHRHHDSMTSAQLSIAASQDGEEIETLPEGSTAAEFEPRPVSSNSVTSPMPIAGRGSSPRHLASGGTKRSGGWFNFFQNVGKKSNAFESTGGPGGGGGGGGTSVISSHLHPRSAPVKIDPKVFFANERTFLAWMHVSVILAGASVAIVAFSDSHSRSHESQHSPGGAVVQDQLYGVILLPVSIAFILYAMMQYSRRASMIRRKAPGPYVDIVGPTVLTVILMLSIVVQFSIKLYTLM
eukprot:CAMPEP_0183767800 /NCGR_PEP_ID=MMETSP0739-20130205/12404_1 /TAXON_ID=385413 /ORGANISM="Thalassiosira miniscula, Strain CCMP1093" /LENGTH=277 /DNA_ID=CAMNT_0026006739 /DNA_START=252 /DNA_END=1088 /DNA_ORIENTATION=+